MEIKSPGSKIMALKNEVTIPNSSELRQLIVDNPGLPLIIFAGEEAWSGNFPYTAATHVLCKIEELTLFEELWMDKDDYEERLYDDLSDEPGYIGLSEKEYSNAISKIVEATEFIKAITVWLN